MIFVDFDIETYVYNTLSALQVQVYNTRADIEEDTNTFITFQETKNEDALIADNVRRKTKFTVLVKTFSYDDLFELNRKLEIAMQKAGFLRLSKRKTVDIELECNMTIYKFEYVAPTTIIENEGEQ